MGCTICPTTIDPNKEAGPANMLDFQVYVGSVHGTLICHKVCYKRWLPLVNALFQCLDPSLSPPQAPASSGSQWVLMTDMFAFTVLLSTSTICFNLHQFSIYINYKVRTGTNKHVFINSWLAHGNSELSTSRCPWLLRRTESIFKFVFKMVNESYPIYIHVQTAQIMKLLPAGIVSNMMS